MRYKIYLILVSCFLFSAIGGPASGGLAFGLIYAQELPTLEHENVDIILNPEHPGPNQEVTARAQSFIFDINQTRFTWLIDDKQVASGMAEKTMTFKTGNTGSRTTITLVADTPAGTRLTQTRVLRVGNVDLLWSANTRVPFWYPGKSLIGPGARVTVNALPHIILNGRTIPASELTFNWSVDGKSAPLESGRGARSFSFTASGIPETEHVIKAELSTAGEEVMVDKFLIVTISRPQIIFYEVHPLFGRLTQTALTSAETDSQSTIEIAAEQFFFSSPISDLAFEWTINGEILGQETLDNRDRLILQTSDANQATGISLFIKGITNLFERARAQMSITTK